MFEERVRRQRKLNHLQGREMRAINYSDLLVEVSLVPFHTVTLDPLLPLLGAVPADLLRERPASLLAAAVGRRHRARRRRPVHPLFIASTSAEFQFCFNLYCLGSDAALDCRDDARWMRYLEIAGAEDAADGARRGELKEFAGGRGRGGRERRQRRQLVRGRRRRRVEAAATADAAHGHVGQLQVHRERVRADAPLDAAVVVVRRRERGGVAGRRRRREAANIAAVEVPAARGGAGDLRRDGDGQRGGGGEARAVVVHEGVAVGGGGGGLAEHGWLAFGRGKASGLCANCGGGLGGV